jgi:hypothetical protein
MNKRLLKEGDDQYLVVVVDGNDFSIVDTLNMDKKLFSTVEWGSTDDADEEETMHCM